MANVSIVQKEIEPFVRKWLSKQYGGKKFHSKKLTLSTGKMNEFDAVSEDDKVVAAILCNRVKTRGGSSNTGAHRKAECDFWRLANVVADGKVKRLMVFTDPILCEKMIKAIGHPEVLGVEFRVYKLPAKLEDRLQKSLQVASREQKARGD
jgi:hypothetical protein